MFNYILRRLLLMIPTIFGILLINFVIIQFVPGGPVERMIAQLQGHNTDATARFSGGGNENAMRELIANGTLRMPGFKYTYAPAQIDAIIAYVKTLPTPAKPNPTGNPTR